ncbi:hypothetical protein PGH12_01325 [Chryseobacterium wangxinyae]|uniref:hypothetical protein n=1 Tax=Chryseobacterium sp. CY350 TaxID=2997336 RepID=UPI00226F1947|nr:hypothetical protein [Chryseobacterium sp. CY350]MCY0977178.1 hypothetical protein [Chryseobacterium sp. CY350]WBZ95801.1 hypothetical protein PGH12_01325 [Chryseobacterium sp. CY350]
MDNIQKQEFTLELIIKFLKERSGYSDYYGLQRMLTKANLFYFEAGFLADRLQQLEYAEYKPSESIKLTQKGWNFISFSYLKQHEDKQINLHELTTQNLILQNENLEYQNSAITKQKEIDDLTVENLKLQNKQFTRYIIYSIIAFVLGAIVTNLEFIYNLFVDKK